MNDINYSQCWEDVVLLKKALAITSEDIVLSITSGGDNTLALLLQKPKRIFSIDINPIQNYLAELKLQSSKVLSYEQYLEFIGVCDSEKRENYYSQISKLLSQDARSWFRNNMKVINGGVIHGGKFERYLNGFRKYLLPLAHSKQTISRFVNQGSLQDQIIFYEKTWDTWRWRFFFNIATNSSLLRKYARQTGATANQTDNINYLKQLEKLIYRNHLKTNYYLCYALLGEYGESLPDYLLEEIYGELQKCSSDAYKFKSESLLDFLKNTASNSLTKFNLSDTFEFLTVEEAVKIWEEIIRTAKGDAVVVYWCNQLEHMPPQKIKQNVVCNADLEAELKEQDRLYFYGSFHIYTITK
ncbi:MAG: hypothetical protein COW61_03100 [Candidatus Yonathbacteria bacterium CG17_big_fil_post_rev_8_21_14_2_50_46_19]|nr:MAG: hypothetical protein COX54_00605 [Candidatus Yonathbacteria bacterium CG23_combo_of_CG06-09_8_20_14_all_46_18]PIQ31848.1 MAG: hypothetical protein COW61_03100 [Candidatus Yonathbacteria bacterium CG17_big_fil_post_rev_8_21_14_2_50_46_19]